MKVGSLQRILQRLVDIYGAGGASKEAKDVKLVIEALESHGDKSVEEFVTETQQEIKASVTRKKKDLDLSAVTQHSERLLKAGTDKSAFDAAFSLLETDKAVSKSEIVEIANVYLNRPSGGLHVFRFDTAKDAKARIRRVFAERWDVQSKNNSIEKLTGWGQAR